jgi:hypothetical protein
MGFLGKLAIRGSGRRRQETRQSAIDAATVVVGMGKRPMIIVDGDTGKIIQANAAAYGLFGVPLIGQPLDRIVPKRHQEAHKEHRRDYMQLPVARPMGVGIEVQAVTGIMHVEVLVEIGLTPIPMTRLILAEIDPLEVPS